MNPCRKLLPSNSRSGTAIDAELRRLANLPLARLGAIPEASSEVLAILGGGHSGASFKDLLGLGIMVLALETGELVPGQPVAESSSGSMGAGLSWGGRFLGHPVTIISDSSIPRVTKAKIELLGSELIEVRSPHPTGGWQQAREERLRQLRQERPRTYFVAQNDNPLNPAVHARWLVPMLQRRIHPMDIAASVFVVGSGGHFSALSRWLKSKNPRCRTFAADHPGSVTFGTGSGGTSRIRGVGNSNSVPKVIEENRHLVDDVIVVGEEEALLACRSVAMRHGLFVGGSSGIAYAAACKVARRIKSGIVLTMFPDRGEIYTELFSETIWNKEWILAHAS